MRDEDLSLNFLWILKSLLTIVNAQTAELDGHLYYSNFWGAAEKQVTRYGFNLTLGKPSPR